MSNASWLRRTAKDMREHIETLPEAPWWAAEVKDIRDPRSGVREWVVDAADRMIAGNVGIAEDKESEAVALHIAICDPDFLSAVADLLDRLAQDNADLPEARAVADTYQFAPALLHNDDTAAP